MLGVAEDGLRPYPLHLIRIMPAEGNMRKFEKPFPNPPETAFFVRRRIPAPQEETRGKP
jgi:hypothetical protein